MKTRRDFIKLSALGSASLAVYHTPFSSFAGAGVLGANERMNVAVIGIRSRAKALISAIHNYQNARIVYNCDVDQQILDEHSAWCEENIGYIPPTEKDFRKILEDKNVDAVFIATPEHWHAPMSIMALEAGKHVYVEKPCSHNLFENDLLIKAQKKYTRLVQMGNQQRSAETSINTIREIHNGLIGEVFKGEAYYSNNRGSIGKGNVIPAPDSLDWDLWQGPAPRQDYRDNVHPYNWHWFRDWGTGEIHNNGTHEIDICRWALNVDYPTEVYSVGGKYTYDDDWEFPDYQRVNYKFDDGKLITWTGHSRGMIQPESPGRGATIYGSKGIVTLYRNGAKLFGLDGKLINEFKEVGESATTNTVGGGYLDDLHIANFFNSIKGLEKLHSPIDDAGITTHICHLGNIAQDVQRPIFIDEEGKIKKDRKAMKHWKRDYEDGWEPKI